MKASNYILIVLWIAVLVSTISPMASAEGVKQGVNNLQFTCRVNGGIPSSLATFNFSLYYQNGSVLLDNVQATSQGQGSFNYTVNLQSLETYTLKEFCYDTLGNSSNQESIILSSTGNSLTITLILFLFIGAFLFLILSLFGNEEFFIFSSGILFLLGGLFVWINGFGELNNWYTFAIGLVGVGLGVILIFQSYSGDEEEKVEEFD